MPSTPNFREGRGVERCAGGAGWKFKDGGAHSAAIGACMSGGCGQTRDIFASMFLGVIAAVAHCATLIQWKHFTD